MGRRSGERLDGMDSFSRSPEARPDLAPGKTDIWAAAAFEILLETARHYQAVIEYAALGSAIQERTGVTTRQGIQNWISPVLGRVVERCHREGVPPLTALVVHKADGMVGAGYDAVLKAQGVAPLDDPMQREHHAAGARLECYRWAEALDLPTDGGQATLAPRLNAQLQRKQKTLTTPPPMPTCPNCFVVLPLTRICDSCG